jgi:hypothetical protein
LVVAGTTGHQWFDQLQPWLAPQLKHR